MSLSRTKGPDVGGAGSTVATMLARDAADFPWSAEGMRFAARPFGVSPFAAEETLSDGVAAFGVVVAPLTPEAPFRSQGDRIEGAEETLYSVASLLLAPPIGLCVVPDDARVDAPICVGLRESPGGVVQLPSFAMEVLSGLDH